MSKAKKWSGMGTWQPFVFGPLLAWGKKKKQKPLDEWSQENYHPQTYRTKKK